ncbi:MAG TPA: hypothetical protein VIL97_00560 [Thermoanaerobaculia bacterium]
MTPERSFPIKLHIGSGSSAIPGWINIDRDAYPGVNRVLDVRDAFPFEDVQYIFAEHFVEHLKLDEALTFFGKCREALRDDGVLRISTPNLDWIWLTHYRSPERMSHDDATVACLEINRAFHGWGHRFLYNRETITRALRAAGFGTIENAAYGMSRHEQLRGLERHERGADTEDHSHVLIVEACDRIAPEIEFISQAKTYITDSNLD